MQNNQNAKCETNAMSKPSKEALFKWPLDGVTDTIEETLAVADADRVLVSWIKP